MDPLEIVSHQLGGDGHVHGAEEREPAIGRIAEGGNLAFGIDYGLFGAGVNSAAGAKAGGDDDGVPVPQDGVILQIAAQDRMLLALGGLEGLRRLMRARNA